MKAVLAFLTSSALAAGLLWGYVDHTRTRTGTDAAAKVERVPAAASPAREPAPLPVPEPKAVPPPPPPPEPPLSVPDQEELLARIKEIESAILKEDFAAVPDLAGPMVEKFRRNPQASPFLKRLRQAEKKAQAYAAVLASLAPRELPDPLYRVEISNGVKFIASQAKETAEGWRFEVISGGFSSWSRDRVSSVKPFPRKVYLDGRWKEIQESSKDWKDPVDLFFFGVRKCFRDGLRAQGLGLLDRLLAMPQSAQVLVIYDKDGTAVRSWEQASGRQPLEPLSKEEEAQFAAVSGEAGSTAPREDEDQDDAKVLRRVEELIAEAETTFREGKGNHEKTFEARTLIWGPVAKILFGLPPDDPRVLELKRRAQDLMARIMDEK